MKALLGRPKLSVGDSNGELQSLESVVTFRKQEGWLGSCAHAHRWGGKAEEATCHTNAVAKETRIDHVFANA